MSAILEASFKKAEVRSSEICIDIPRHKYPIQHGGDLIPNIQEIFYLFLYMTLINIHVYSGNLPLELSK